MRTSVRIIERSTRENRDCDASGVLPGLVGGWKGSGGPPHPVWLTQCDWDTPSVHVRGTWKDGETEGDRGGRGGGGDGKGKCHGGEAAARNNTLSSFWGGGVYEILGFIGF